ncbi:MAG: DUF342 domain-containing protein [Gemmatimonadetes bacterium]|nr:DUF342 domain-containing protein [Gemmatimonadota bacterium]MBT7862191.1 DUF342 domain-containing protein [Gemmatimonadota bacterium]
MLREASPTPDGASVPEPSTESAVVPKSAAVDDTKIADPADGSAAAPSDPLQVPLELSITDDGLQAIVKAIFSTTAPEHVEQLLRENDICEGVSEEAIQQAIKIAADKGAKVEAVVVAEGRAPRPAGAPRLEPRLPPSLEALPNLESVVEVLSREHRQEVSAALSDLSGWLVTSGQVIATLLAEEGEAGISVQGKPLPIPPADLISDTRLQPGEGVELAPNGTNFVATVAGLAGQLHGSPAVVPQVWITQNGMGAYLACPEAVPGSTSPTAQDLAGTLGAAGVTDGIDTSMLESLSERLSVLGPGEPLVQVAAGHEVIAPVDATPVFNFDHHARSGSVRPDGSIDFRDRNVFPPVHAEELLVTSGVPELGTEGRTVRGEILPVDAPRDVELVPGENVRHQAQDGLSQIHAEIDGGAAVQIEEEDADGGGLVRYTVHVYPITQVDGDVGYETGHIDVPGSVLISGTIKAGFHVKASGDVAVSGSVDDGAIIQAGGNVTVQLGIVGDETKVEATGSIAAKFVQEATLRAGEDITVGSYIHNADVAARGSVNVEGAGGAGGGIIGGTVWGAKGLTTRNLGSAGSTGTHVRVGVDREEFAEVEKAQAIIRQVDTLLPRLLQSAGVASLDADQIRISLSKNPGRKKVLKHYIKKATQLTSLKQAHIEKRRQLLDQISAKAQSVVIAVADTAYARTEVGIGGHQLSLQDDLKAVKLCLDTSTDPPAIGHRPLHEEAGQETSGDAVSGMASTGSDPTP